MKCFSDAQAFAVLALVVRGDLCSPAYLRLTAVRLYQPLKRVLTTGMPSVLFTAFKEKSFLCRSVGLHRTSSCHDTFWAVHDPPPPLHVPLWRPRTYRTAFEKSSVSSNTITEYAERNTAKRNIVLTEAIAGHCVTTRLTAGDNHNMCGSGHRRSCWCCRWRGSRPGENTTRNTRRADRQEGVKNTPAGSSNE